MSADLPGSALLFFTRVLLRLILRRDRVLRATTNCRWRIQIGEERHLIVKTTETTPREIQMTKIYTVAIAFVLFAPVAFAIVAQAARIIA